MGEPYLRKFNFCLFDGFGFILDFYKINIRSFEMFLCWRKRVINGHYLDNVFISTFKSSFL